jgi:assimilatory nitrate reductase catalytic subunit
VDSARGDIVVRVKSDAGLTRQRLAADALGQPVHEQRRRQRADHLGTRPYSHQPELKHAAVAVNKAELPWQLVILRKAGVGELAALALLARARTLLGEFAFASVGLYGRASRW